jgi:hypothetical protein
MSWRCVELPLDISCDPIDPLDMPEPLDPLDTLDPLLAANVRPETPSAAAIATANVVFLILKPPNVDCGTDRALTSRFECSDSDASRVSVVLRTPPSPRDDDAEAPSLLLLPSHVMSCKRHTTRRITPYGARQRPISARARGVVRICPDAALSRQRQRLFCSRKT